MNYNQTLIKRADFIIGHAKESLSKGKRDERGNLEADRTKALSFRTIGLSFILDLFGSEYPYRI